MTNLALQTGQIGLFAHGLAKMYGIKDYNSPMFYLSPSQINPIQSDISSIGTEQLTRNKWIANIEMINTPSSAGRWLTSSSKDQLLSLVGGKINKNQLNLVDKLSHKGPVTIELLTVLLAEIKNRAISSSFFNTVNEGGYLEFFKHHINPVLEYMTTKDSNDIHNLFEKIINRKSSPEEMISQLLNTRPNMTETNNPHVAIQKKHDFGYKL